MLTKRFVCSVVALILAFVAAAVVCPAKGKGRQGALVLTLTRSSQNTSISPGSSWYAADVLNQSSAPQLFEVIRMPGGYAGSGRFFACGIDYWDTRLRKWSVLRPLDRSEFGRNPVETFALQPGERIEVCKWLLPSQAGSLGQCVRLTVHRQWAKHSDHLCSEPFSIGNGAPAKGTPCSH